MNEKELWQIYNKSRKGTYDACPGENELAAYIDNRLNEEERDRVEAHLSLCSSCLDAALALKELERKKIAAQNLDDTYRAKPANVPFTKSIMPWAAASVILIFSSYTGIKAGRESYTSSQTVLEQFCSEELKPLAESMSEDSLLDFDFGDLR